MDQAKTMKSQFYCAYKKYISIVIYEMVQEMTMMLHFYCVYKKSIDGMNQDKTMWPHFYFVCKVVLYINRWYGPGKNNDATFLLCLQSSMYI